MQKWSYISAVMVLTFLLVLLTAPAIAMDDVPSLVRPGERFSHSIQFNVDGRITIDRQLGHECTTGAVKKTRVRGFGAMTKTETVRIAPNIMAIDEITDWTTADNAIQNLAVATTIQLCNRPMSTAAAVYDEGNYEIEQGDIINTYHPLVLSGDLAVNAATRQLWATNISVNPGESGSYHSDFIAAYGPGPYEAAFGARDREGQIFFYDEDYMWEYDPDVMPQERNTRLKGYERGDYYVGNYFDIDQYAYTSGGEFSRLISISSPFTGGYLEEEMSVAGMAQVRESFNMENLEGGPKAITLAWYELF